MQHKTPADVSLRDGRFTINCLWVGLALRPLERVCALSMLRQGHRVRIFSYGKLENVPEGIEMADARDVLPEASLLRHRKSGSPALGSNVFRYRLMEQARGLWLDLDVLLLKPIPETDDPVFGWQDPTLINGAVLHIPKESPLLAALLDFVAEAYPVPPFYSSGKQHWLRLRKAIGLGRRVEAMRWGTFGPRALTHFAAHTNSARFARPVSVFYPIHPRESHGPFQASFDTAARLTDETIALHLWNEKLRRPSRLRRDNPVGRLIVEPGSFVHQFAKAELGMRLTGD
ncbi:MAG: galactosyltransferase Lgt5 [Devosia sp.]|nr:galactosyltransferase Lgt5 [Devosia sp.]